MTQFLKSIRHPFFLGLFLIGSLAHTKNYGEKAPPALPNAPTTPITLDYMPKVKAFRITKFNPKTKEFTHSLVPNNMLSMSDYVGKTISVRKRKIPSAYEQYEYAFYDANHDFYYVPEQGPFIAYLNRRAAAATAAAAAAAAKKAAALKTTSETDEIYTEEDDLKKDKPKIRTKHNGKVIVPQD